MAQVTWRAAAAGLMLAIASLSAGCGSGASSQPPGTGTVSTGTVGTGTVGTGTGSAAGASATASAGDAAVDYWTRVRLLAAAASHRWALPANGEVTPGATPSAHAPALPAPRVGALFAHSASGNHFCTASVVTSQGHDLLITAAHCINSGKGGGYNQDIVFIPGYQDGATPYGVWTPAKLLVDPHWAASSDPDYDVGFVVLQSSDGKNIEDVLGANRIEFDAGYSHLVRVTGYPSSADVPVTCRNWTSEQSASQLRFECGGFFGGTSGSPWITGFDPLTRTGTIVGVIGGYQAGGDTDSVSYSVYLNDSIRALYRQAEAAG